MIQIEDDDDDPGTSHAGQPRARPTVEKKAAARKLAFANRGPFQLPPGNIWCFTWKEGSDLVKDAGPQCIMSKD